MNSSSATPPVLPPALPRRLAARAVRRLRPDRSSEAAPPPTPSEPPASTPAPTNAALSRRVAVLEREVQELRRLSRRLADVTDVVTELLVPAVDRDDERLATALGRLEQRTPGSHPADDGEPDTDSDAETL